ncbi:MAG: hypothetical protein ACI4EG_12320 [Fusicatenibacter sp.]|nr:DUF4064 domain-containing protein [Fusicatenibacter sp.]
MSENQYDPNHTNDPDYQNANPYGPPSGQRPGPYQHYQPQPPVHYKEPGSQSLAAASMVMSICSFLFMMSGGFTVFAALGILFALLSRGSGKMSGTAKAGLIGSVAGIVIGIVIYIVVFFSLFRNIGIQDYLEDYQQYFNIEEYQQEEPSNAGNIARLTDIERI